MAALPRAHAWILVAAMLALSGCVSGPRQKSGEATLGERIATAAMTQLGRPYRYGGGGPDAFDCSGLVRWAHERQGVLVPRTTDEQYQAARTVDLRRLSAGDLLFFRFDGPKVTHVAIYTGNGRFVHAPQTGRPVETRALNDAGYRNHLVGAGRLY